MHQQVLLDSLPAHLKVFVSVQNYAMYTPRDQAVWRFLLQQLQPQLLVTAHPVYTQGLAQAGISTEYIPCLEEMNARLAVIGWSVVGVDGFIPPEVFMAFQARRILAIATTMRSVEQMLYTPAPDIVHESAGHAPFLIDVDYAEFLQRFGEVGMKVLNHKQDQVVVDAIRQLSIIKGQVDVDAC
ncbi:MAG: phenylalanine-4-hydroxylase, partial [Crocinitomicaceae bacterium]